MKVLRAVGEVVGSVAKGMESAVLDLPNVRGTLAVCRESFGRLDAVVAPGGECGGCGHDMFAGGCGVD